MARRLGSREESEENVYSGVFQFIVVYQKDLLFFVWLHQNTLRRQGEQMESSYSFTGSLFDIVEIKSLKTQQTAESYANPAFINVNSHKHIT
jgi:hypothetical protein